MAPKPNDNPINAALLIEELFAAAAISVIIGAHGLSDIANPIVKKPAILVLDLVGFDEEQCPDLSV